MAFPIRIDTNRTTPAHAFTSTSTANPTRCLAICGTELPTTLRQLLNTLKRYVEYRGGELPTLRRCLPALLNCRHMRVHRPHHGARFLVLMITLPLQMPKGFIASLRKQNTRT